MTFFKSSSLGLALLSMLLMVAESSSGGQRSSYNYDLSGPDLTKLYNSKVHEAERVSRPISGVPFMRHSGVRVTLEDGTRWLVHKGNNYGISSQTIVEDADNMSGRWRVDETKDFGGTKTVSDLVKAGGSDYKLLKANCHHASGKMMED